MNNGFSLDRRPKNLEQHETLLLSLAFASVVKLLNSKAIFKDLLWNVSNFINTTVNNFVWWNQNNIWNLRFQFSFCEFLLSFQLLGQKSGLLKINLNDFLWVKWFLYMSEHTSDLWETCTSKIKLTRLLLWMFFTFFCSPKMMQCFCQKTGSNFQAKNSKLNSGL